MSTIYYGEREKYLTTLISKRSKLVMRDLPGDQFERDQFVCWELPRRIFVT